MQPFSRPIHRNLVLQISIVAFLAILMAVVSSLSLKGIVHGTLQKEAERKALAWADEFVSQIPDLVILADTGNVSPTQVDMFNASISGGEIFRFKFFSPTGELKYISDESEFAASGESTHSDQALRVFASRENDISIKYGEDIPNRPETFVEAYIPAVLPSGQVLGVIEVYVDVSSLATTLQGLVLWLGALLVSIGAIAFLIPASILVFRNGQIWKASTRETWLAAILDHAPFEVVIKDTKGKIRAISRNVTQEFDLNAQDFIGKTTADFLPDSIAEDYMLADEEVVRTGKATQKEVVETTDQSTRYSLSSKFPLKDRHGQITGICSITNDITDLKMSEAKLAQAQKMKTVGQLTGGIAHDFNNLLSVVSGSLQLLENSADEVERKTLTRVALRAIEHGSSLTKQMLALGRRSPLISKPTSLNSSLAEFEEFFLRILPANIEFSIHYDPTEPNVIVDPGMLQNAILNVALNSKTAMPKGGKLTISAAVVTAPDDFPDTFALDGKCAVIEIVDTGKGISKKDLNSVFEPFFTTHEVGKGSGLGLPMVKGFIEQSHGSIRIESKPDSGTTLSAFLPLTFDPVEVSEEALSKAKSQQSNKARGTILVVEDNLQLLNIIALTLERENYHVIKKPSGDDALEVLTEQTGIRLVLSDLVMPGQEQGVDVLRKAKSLHPPLPVILMSGYADIRISNEEDLKLADKFVEKPFALGHLSKEIKDLISQGNA
ncbi:PAS domain-containing sensor histidine kinase [uncultured Pelagimonas sp.]|uniref:PAS domain-containing sensor histidine kinase n=1 Tax=uncultured Pelagimonas sp. TaxID=1618102 RepID=UPI00260B2F88|nr:PAS domain-containing sensor histidine kinase [uncultured Pelagimonas sp.]